MKHWLRFWVGVIVAVAVVFGYEAWNLNEQSIPSSATAGTVVSSPVKERPTSGSPGPSTSGAPATTAKSSASPGIRGVVEGFYGKPWSLSQRQDMLRFMAQHDFNTYVYAPKNDPYQREEWKVRYPAKALREMKQLAATSAQQGVHFVYSISPGIPQSLPGQKLTNDEVSRSITYTSPTDVQKLEDKIRQMQSIGVHTFMLSFDDVDKSLKAADQRVYGKSYTRAQVDLANRVLQDERKQDPKFQLWFAPVTYYGTTDNADWRVIRSRLNPAIQVIWTGHWVLNQSVTTAQVDAAAKWLGRKPILWDNYPVNDYTYAVQNAPRLLMGPLQHRSGDLPTHIAGYIANPMIQPEASKVALTTISIYLQHPKTYQSEDALRLAVQELPGVGDPAAFLRFCKYSATSTLQPKGNSEFAAFASNYWTARKKGNSAQAEQKLRAELTQVKYLPDRLQASVRNTALMDEINPWLKKLGNEGELALQTLDYLNLPTSNPARVKQRAAISKQLQLLKKDKHRVGDNILAFVDEGLKH